MSDEKSFVFQIIFPCIQCAIFSSEFQYFPLSLVFISLTVILSVSSFFFFFWKLPLLGILELPKLYVYVFDRIWEIHFFLLFLLIPSSSPVFLLFSWNSNYPYVSLFKIVLQVLNVCFFTLSLFFLAFSQIALFPLPYLQVHWISLCVFPLKLGHVFLAFHQHIRLYLDILRVILKRFWIFFFFFFTLLWRVLRCFVLTIYSVRFKL